MKVLDDAYDEFVEAIKSVGYGVPYMKDCDERARWYWGKLDSGEVSANLRLDWELIDDIVNEAGSEDKVIDIFMENMKLDLEDIIINGDTNLSTDPLLKIFDGSKKRGVEPEKVIILSGMMYREFKPNSHRVPKPHGLYEYTLYLRPYIKWPCEATN